MQDDSLSLQAKFIE